MKYGIPLLLLFSTLFFSSCESCGPQRELTFHLSLYSEDSTVSLRRVYAKNAVDTSYFDRTLNYEPSFTGWYFDLPFSMHEDETTYFFEFDNRTDSLRLSYRRKFYYKDGCGFVIDAEHISTEGSFAVVATSSTPYIGKERDRFLYEYRGGINVSASL